MSKNKPKHMPDFDPMEMLETIGLYAAYASEMYTECPLCGHVAQKTTVCGYFSNVWVLFYYCRTCDSMLSLEVHSGDLMSTCVSEIETENLKTVRNAIAEIDANSKHIKTVDRMIRRRKSGMN